MLCENSIIFYYTSFIPPCTAYGSINNTRGFIEHQNRISALVEMQFRQTLFKFKDQPDTHPDADTAGIPRLSRNALRVTGPELPDRQWAGHKSARSHPGSL